MIDFRPSLSQASTVAATALFATSTFARSGPEPLVQAAAGGGPAAWPMADNARVRKVFSSVGPVRS